MKVSRAVTILFIFPCASSFLTGVRVQTQSFASKANILSCLVDDTASEISSDASPIAATAMSRRNSFHKVAWLLATIPSLATADEQDSSAVVTDKIFIDVSSPTSSEPDRIVIGLFGKAAPNSAEMVRQLVSSQGLPTPCRPKAQRNLQKEQLEANKVYNVCKDGEDEGVSLKYSTIWRIRKDQGIDVGAVTGKYVAREYPTFADESVLSHNAAGLVSVRRGNDSGFGFTISPKSNPSMDKDFIVVGQVLKGMDAIEKLNNTPVVNSASGVNYMALTGGPKTTNAPDRSCRYGGPMYCNENKPLVKLKIVDCGIL